MKRPAAPITTPTPRAPAPSTPRAPAAPGTAQDGRRRRSLSSRAKIVSAVMEFTRAGDFAPSAQRVADMAGVGLRTVFRHFDDMDTLFREITTMVEAEVMPIILQPVDGDTWQDKLAIVVERRAAVFETIMPFRLSANVKRYQSAFLMADYLRINALERRLVEAVLPADLLVDRVGVDALHIALGFQTWRALRYDQQLPADVAVQVVRRMVADWVARLPHYHNAPAMLLPQAG
ncbi:MAG: TetR/AcrR family transcriptional regulator [Sphingopyxis sp.]